MINKNINCKKIGNLVLWLIIFQLIGFLLGRLTQNNIATWYQSLHKSVWNPPEIVFPIVWSILYVMIALAGWSLWQYRQESRARLALFFYVIQVLMNWTWTPIFFHWHFIGLGFFLIILMVLFTLITILITRKKYLFATLMLIPYWLWLWFAAYLNYFIWIHN